MDTPENFNKIPGEPNSFDKYGIRINPDNTIQGPKRPPLYSETPPISQEGRNLDLAPHRAFLERVFQNRTISTPDEKAELMGVVNKIFTSATDKQLGDYSKFVFMDRQDWDQFRPILRGNAEEGRKFDAVNLGGLIVIGAEWDDRILPLLFHETGHSLYPPTNDSFTDELRAYYFQRVCTEMLHKQLEQIGLPYRYPDGYADDAYPSKAHRDAHLSANALYSYLKIPALQVEDETYFSERMRKYSALIKPSPHG